MNISKSTKVIKSPVTAATKSGTKYYKVSKKDLFNALADNDANIWICDAIDSNGLDAIDLENNLFGSRIIDDCLYVCETDGRDILVAGEYVDPERALFDCDLNDLAPYIEEPEPDRWTKMITEHEVIIEDIDARGRAMITDSGYGFIQVVRDGLEIGLFD